MKDPIALFAEWYAEAQQCGLKEPTAMTLATASKDGKPSARIILLKQYDEDGFVFYTNAESRKGGELRENPHAALLFYWMPLGKQVRVEGKVEQVPEEMAIAYFNSRHPQSRIGAWASQQSREVKDRNALMEEVQCMRERYPNDEDIPKPPYWHGFRVIPEAIEFWVEGNYRIHDRTVYEREGDGWKVKTLYP